MIAQRATELQPALFSMENAATAESQRPTANVSTMPGQGGGLASDPLIDETRQARRRDMALTLCQYAATGASWEMANRLAAAWGFSCQALGVDRPADPEKERRR